MGEQDEDRQHSNKAKDAASPKRYGDPDQSTAGYVFVIDIGTVMAPRPKLRSRQKLRPRANRSGVHGSRQRVLDLAPMN
jgi:hypothetical protein